MPHIIAYRQDKKGERRYFFPATSIFEDPDSTPMQARTSSNWAEIPVQGAHSDIGGGYRYKDHRGIANSTLQMMYNDMMTHGIKMHPLKTTYLDITDKTIHDSDWWNDKLLPAPRRYLPVPARPEISSKPWNEPGPIRKSFINIPF